MLIITPYPSICVVSIIRIVAIKRLNLDSDVSYDAVLDSFVSSLEPTLGVINACLPILQPVISKISDGTNLAWSKLTSSDNTPREGSRYQGTPLEPLIKSKSQRFRRLPADLYPLTDITATQSYTSGLARQTASDTNMEALSVKSDHHTSIEVKHFIGVESTAITQS